MIKVNRLNGKEFVVNCDMIMYIEETPDTIITLKTGQKIVVSDKIDDIIQKTIEYKAKIEKYRDFLLRKEV